MDLEQKGALVTGASGRTDPVVMQRPNQHIANVVGFDRKASSPPPCYAYAH